MILKKYALKIFVCLFVYGLLQNVEIASILW
jgi:hypothetical protein